MFDTSTGQILWQKEQKEGLIFREAVITEAFSGLFFVEVVEEMNGRRNGHFKLFIYNNDTGEEIYQGVPWIFQVKISGHACASPVIAAKGNYLFALSTHARYSDDPKHESCDSFICIKVDAKNKACQVRKTSSGLDTVILAKVLQDEELDQEKKTEYTVIHGYDSSILSCVGFAFDSVVLIHARLEYERDNRSSFKAQTVCSVDLDRLMDTHEPAGVFSAINFPLGRVAFSTFHSEAKCVTLRHYPHYETRNRDGKGPIKLTGIVELPDNTSGPAMPKIYKFAKSLEAKKKL